MSKKSLLIGLAFSSIVLAGGALAHDKKEHKHHKKMDKKKMAMMGQCHGINACKGMGKCAGDGHSCAGKNKCAGHGWLKMSKKACLAKKGKFTNHKMM